MPCTPYRELLCATCHFRQKDKCCSPVVWILRRNLVVWPLVLRPECRNQGPGQNTRVPSLRHSHSASRPPPNPAAQVCDLVVQPSVSLTVTLSETSNTHCKKRGGALPQHTNALSKVLALPWRRRPSVLQNENDNPPVTPPLPLHPLPPLRSLLPPLP